MDTIHSACCWVDLPDVSGLVFMPSITKGAISYEVMNGRAPTEGSDNWLYIYDPVAASWTTGAESEVSAPPGSRRFTPQR